MFYKFAAAALIVCLAACSDDASPTIAAPTDTSSSSSSVILSSDSRDDSAGSSTKSSDSQNSSSSSETTAASSSSVILSGDSREGSSSSTEPALSAADGIENLSSCSPKVTEPAEVTENLSSSSTKGDSGTEAGMTSSSSAISSSSEGSSEPAETYLWNDEFDGDAIDNSKWTFDIGTGSSGWGNNEWEYYTDRKENAYVKDGVLHIRAQKEDYEGQKYTSARILTKGKFTFKYGTVEARIALPTGKGIWPAFWMLGENFDTVGWPACGEIDIIEAVNTENKIYGTNHWANGSEYATYGNNTGNYRDQKFELDITQFHTYKFTWDEKYIRMFVDDFMYHEILIENNEGDTEEFHKPFFFLLNVAVAGNWPGFDVDDTQFPNEMLVDYIRVSQQ